MGVDWLKVVLIVINILSRRVFKVVFYIDMVEWCECGCFTGVEPNNFES
jgi:hypothetical protein